MGDSQDELLCAAHIVSIIADQFFFIVGKTAAAIIKSETEDEEVEEIEEIDEKWEDCETQQLLSVLWLYSTWIEAKKISLFNKGKNDFSWIQGIAQLVDSIHEMEEPVRIPCENLYFCPLSFVDYESATTSSLASRLTVILWRTLQSYKISDVPDANFTDFVVKRQSAFVEKKRTRVSRTVPILSSL